jgi:hypothetical protein
LVFLGYFIYKEEIFELNGEFLVSAS